jgi:hypothetical protein
MSPRLLRDNVAIAMLLMCSVVCEGPGDRETNRSSSFADVPRKHFSTKSFCHPKCAVSNNLASFILHPPSAHSFCLAAASTVFHPPSSTRPSASMQCVDAVSTNFTILRLHPQLPPSVSASASMHSRLLKKTLVITPPATPARPKDLYPREERRNAISIPPTPSMHPNP